MAYFLHFGLTPRSGAPVRIPGWNLSVKARGVRLPYGENFIILISTILDWFTHVTDRQTDRHTDRQTGDIAYGALNIWNEQGCATTNLPLTIALKCFLKLHSVTAFWRAPQSTHRVVFSEQHAQNSQFLCTLLWLSERLFIQIQIEIIFIRVQCTSTLSGLKNFCAKQLFQVAAKWMKSWSQILHNFFRKIVVFRIYWAIVVTLSDVLSLWVAAKKECSHLP